MRRGPPSGQALRALYRFVMSSSVQLRDARPSDCQVISDIYNHYVRNDTCTYTEEVETLGERQEWFAKHGPRHPVLIAEVQGAVVGWGSLSTFRDRSAYRFCTEDSIYLRPETRGQGVGSALLAELIVRARLHGFHTIIAGISAEQTASVGLHAKFGFTTVAQLREVGFKFNRWLDVLYMELMLA